MRKQPRWLVLRTKPRCEKRAYRALLEKGIEAYLPLQKELRQWSDRRKWVEEPLFRGYIFVQLAPGEEYRVFYIPGVTHLVRFGDDFAVVRDEEIAFIRHLIEEGVPLKVVDEVFEPGEEVEITWGGFQGYRGEVVHYRGKKRLAIRIAAVTKTLLVEVPVESVTRVG